MSADVSRSPDCPAASPASGPAPALILCRTCGVPSRPPAAVAWRPGLESRLQAGLVALVAGVEGHILHIETV